MTIGICDVEWRYVLILRDVWESVDARKRVMDARFRIWEQQGNSCRDAREVLEIQDHELGEALAHARCQGAARGMFVNGMLVIVDQCFSRGCYRRRVSGTFYATTANTPDR